MLIDQIKIAHGLSNLKTVQKPTYNDVLSGLQGSQPIILKLGFDTDAIKRHWSAFTSPITGSFTENERIFLMHLKCFRLALEH